MKTALLIPFLLLVGCGGPPMQYRCDSPTFIVESEVEIDCNVMNRDIEIAKNMMDIDGFLPADQFNETFKNVVVEVRDVSVLAELADGKVLVGQYFSNSGNKEMSPLIILTSNASQLLHEALHHIDHLRGHGSTSWDHVGWKENGYLNAGLLFESKSNSPNLHWNHQ